MRKQNRIKSDIKKKLKTFTESEIPLLIQNGFIDSFDLSKYTQNLRTNPQINDQKNFTIIYGYTNSFSKYGGPGGI